MDENNIGLVSIGELCRDEYNFIIPEYQRGYRWDKQQVEELLNDIEEFANKNDSEDNKNIYCIQPLILKKAEDGKWIVVDGQQRLTTILLILNRISSDDKYSIKYAKEDNENKILEQIMNNRDDKQEDKYKNVDAYHLIRARETIEIKVNDWKKTDVTLKKIQKAILDKVCFIQYIISENDEPIKVFTRLNIGKIPLTDAELIRAVLLNRKNYTGNDKNKKQDEMAFSWDRIENSLQNDQFWLFIHDKKYDKPTRIDYLFEIKKYAIEKEEKVKKDEKEERALFNYFYNIYKEKETQEVIEDWINELWNDVKKYHSILEEWYQDYRLYHYIGYLITVNSSTKTIYELIEFWDETGSKTEFIDGLKGRISDYLSKFKWISKWYKIKFDEEILDKDVSDKKITILKKECRNLLLLHNVETIVKNNENLENESKYRIPDFTKFPFHLYKLEKGWDIEHIRPDAGDGIKKLEAMAEWLKTELVYINDDTDLRENIKEFIKDVAASKEPTQNFIDLHERVIKANGNLNDDNKNKIWNYTLLDSSTNREYGNNSFPVKRRYIACKEQGSKIKIKYIDVVKKEEKLGEEVKWKYEVVTEKKTSFFPPCTRNVFNKSYSKNINSLVSWTEDDAKDYLEDMKEKLQPFIDAVNSDNSNVELDDPEGETDNE